MPALEGSTDAARCANCETPLTGRYCAQCGQDRRDIPSVRGLLGEVIGSLTNLDSTFWGTVLPLLTRPGEVTRRYLEGRRRRYAGPVRGYLWVSLIYFLLLSLFGVLGIQAFQITEGEVGSANCADYPISEGLTGWIGETLTSACEQIRADDGQVLSRTLIGLLPTILLVVVPLIAALQWLLFRRTRPRYVDSVIFVLHYQSAYFLANIVLAVVALLLLPVWRSATVALVGHMSMLAYAYGAIYLFIANRRVYDCGPGRALASLCLLMIGYLLFLSLAGTISVVVAMVTLAR